MGWLDDISTTVGGWFGGGGGDTLQLPPQDRQYLAPPEGFADMGSELGGTLSDWANAGTGGDGYGPPPLDTSIPITLNGGSMDSLALDASGFGPYVYPAACRRPWRSSMAARTAAAVTTELGPAPRGESTSSSSCSSSTRRTKCRWNRDKRVCSLPTSTAATCWPGKRTSLCRRAGVAARISGSPRSRRSPRRRTRRRPSRWTTARRRTRPSCPTTRSPARSR